MILFCNLVHVYVHKICDDKFAGCKKLFSWLGQRVNKKINVYGHDADSGTDLCPWPRDDAASRQDISTPFSILIEFEATECSYSIFDLYLKFQGYSIRYSSEIPDPSHPYKPTFQC